VGWRKRPQHFVRGLWSQGRLSAPHYEKFVLVVKVGKKKYNIRKEFFCEVNYEFEIL